MLLRRIARPLLAGIFIYGGINELRDPKVHVQAAEPMLDTMVDFAPIEQAPSSTVMVQVDAGIKIGAGVLLALGKAPRLASTALAASLIPTTLAGHRFWEIEDPRDRSDQLIHFLKNLGLLGGLIIAAADTAGRPSLAWRGRHAGRAAATASQRKLAEMTDVVDTATERGRTLVGKAARLGEEVAGKATSMGDDVAGAIADAAGQVNSRLKTMAR
ncbi:MAG: DoxX family protein [Pseudonocardiales bacterium]